MADVARVAGVSPALVSIVLRGVPGASEETRARVTAIADDIGYVPDRRAQKLRQHASRLLGVTFDLHQPFHGDLVEHLYQAAARRGYDVTLSATAPTRSDEAAFRSLVTERCEGAILLGAISGTDAVAALRASMPTVSVMNRTGADGVGVVRSDDVAGAALAVDHLVELGHTRIAHIDGGDAPGAADRRQGFLDAMTAHGLSPIVHPGGPTETDGAEAIRRLLTDGAPSAVCAFNDRCASGVLDHLARAGVAVPEALAVVGYDNSRLARITHGGLTSISQDAPALADAAVDAALRQIRGEPPVDTVLRPHLVRRATT